MKSVLSFPSFTITTTCAAPVFFLVLYASLCTISTFTTDIVLTELAKNSTRYAEVVPKLCSSVFYGMHRNYVVFLLTLPAFRAAA